MGTGCDRLSAPSMAAAVRLFFSPWIVRPRHQHYAVYAWMVAAVTVVVLTSALRPLRPWAWRQGGTFSRPVDARARRRRASRLRAPVRDAGRRPGGGDRRGGRRRYRGGVIVRPLSTTKEARP